MGCANSKKIRRQCSPNGSGSPLARSRSVPAPPRPSPAKAKGYDHIVTLTSSTLGYLKLDPLHENNGYLERNLLLKEEEEETGAQESLAKEAEEETSRRKNIFSVRKVTPTVTPPGEPETMDVWEIMEGLEEHSPLLLPRNRDAALGRSFSFDSGSLSRTTAPPPRNSVTPGPVWFQVNDSELPGLTEFDPDILDHFRRALEELSPSESSVTSGMEPVMELCEPDVPVKLDNTDSELNPIRTNETTKMAASKIVPLNVSPPFGEDRVVMYVTSLRGIRKTYEDCCVTRLIFKGFGVLVDERDVSMHSAFLDELRDVLGDPGAHRLPRVFVCGRYIGGVEEVRHMNDAGELATLLEGLPSQEAAGSACERCGDVRFVPCETCHGSCKVYEEDGGDFVRCSECNENGIVRCSLCCLSSVSGGHFCF